MTTIKSTATEGRTLTVHHIKDRATLEAEYLLDINDESRTGEGAIYVKAPELLDALGAVPKGSPYAELAEQLHAATQRAEAAEAEALEQAKLVRTFADRAEAAAEQDDYKSRFRTLQGHYSNLLARESDAIGRAEKAEARLADLTEHDSDVVTDLTRRLGIIDLKLASAEATIQRVRELAMGDNELIHAADLARALDLVPPFTLPTEVPATIEAVRDNAKRNLTLWGNGTETYWRDEFTHQQWTPKGVMEHFTAHRLLGAEDA
jgi:hypothetical protein